MVAKVAGDRQLAAVQGPVAQPIPIRESVWVAT